MKKLFNFIVILLYSLFFTASTNAQLGVPMPSSAANAKNSQSSTGPTLAETTQFISNKIDTMGFSFWDYPTNDFYLKAHVLFDGCDAMFVNHFINMGNFSFSYARLEDLDPGSLTYEKEMPTGERYTMLNPRAILKVAPFGSQKKIRYTNFKTSETKEVPTSYTLPSVISKETLLAIKNGHSLDNFSPYRLDKFMYIEWPLEEEELAQRMINAFNHAIKLCSAEANRNGSAKPKELF